MSETEDLLRQFAKDQGAELIKMPDGTLVTVTPSLNGKEIEDVARDARQYKRDPETQKQIEEIKKAMETKKK